MGELQNHPQIYQRMCLIQHSIVYFRFIFYTNLGLFNNNVGKLCPESREIQKLSLAAVNSNLAKLKTVDFRITLYAQLVHD